MGVMATQVSRQVVFRNEAPAPNLLLALSHVPRPARSPGEPGVGCRAPPHGPRAHAVGAGPATHQPAWRARCTTLGPGLSAGIP